MQPTIKPLAWIIGWVLWNHPVASAHDDGLRPLGIYYRLEILSEPVLQRVHVMQVDLTQRKVRPRVIVAADPDGPGPAEALLIHPLRLAADHQVVAFINANPWESLPDAQGRKTTKWYENQPVDILGVARSGGEVRSADQSGYPGVWYQPPTQVTLSPMKQEMCPEAVAGFQVIVREGMSIVSPGGPRHPRTALGFDVRGQTLWMLVVDGRQPDFSEGMTLDELAKFLVAEGCYTAVNLDGGGSSVMGLRQQGELKLVNRPSDRFLGLVSIRPVPVLWALERAQPDAD
ncbi:MAG: hypothetical protein KatS3mg113_0443 [Planctomycetaceae bacterium]|nr:MAG: hypothetical protein KatS3mg113_0443 [Planctomycetaceae bacterium]